MYSDDEEHEAALEITKLLSVKAPAESLGQNDKDKPASTRQKGVVIACTCYDPQTKRLYYGLENGNFAFWQISTEVIGTSRYVGSHKGPITCICTPTKEDGELGAAGLIVSASVDSTIRIWDYKGKVVLSPTVCVQTLYGHTGTITCLVITNGHIISGSTDCSVKVWRAVDGRKQLVYPWYELQSTVVTLDGWVRCMSYDRTPEVGDMGAIFVVDDAGDTVKIVPQGVYDVDTGRIGDHLGFVVKGSVPGNSGGTRLALRRGHDRGVMAVRYVASARLIVTIAYDNCLRVYEEKSGSLLHCWENEVGCQFTSMEVDMELQEILVTDKQGYLSLYSLTSGRLYATRCVSSGPLTSITKVLGPGVYGITTATDFQLWRVDHDLDYNVARGGHEKEVISLYACAGGVGVSTGDLDYRIFSTSIDNTVRLWDPYDMACVRVLNEEESEISAMTFFEAWNILITGHDNGAIRLWNLDTSSHVTLHHHTNTVTCLTIGMMHRHEELLLSSGFDGLVCIWDVRSLRSEAPHLVASFKTQPTLAKLRGAYSLTSVTPPTNFVPGASGNAIPAFSAAAKGEVLALKFDHSKKVILTAGNDMYIKVWSSSSYEYLGRHSGHTDAITCLALDANFMFSGSEDCSIRVWDTVPAGVCRSPPGSEGVSRPTSGLMGFVNKEIKKLVGHTRCVTALEVIPASGHIVSASVDSSLLIWDYVTGEVLRRHEHTEEFKCIALRFDRDEVLIGTDKANILRYAVGEVLGPSNYTTMRLRMEMDDDWDDEEEEENS